MQQSTRKAYMYMPDEIICVYIYIYICEFKDEEIDFTLNFPALFFKLIKTSQIS